MKTGGSEVRASQEQKRENAGSICNLWQQTENNRVSVTRPQGSEFTFQHEHQMSKEPGTFRSVYPLIVNSRSIFLAASSQNQKKIKYLEV